MRVAVNTTSASSPRRGCTGGADDKYRGAPVVTLIHGALSPGGGGSNLRPPPPVLPPAARRGDITLPLFKWEKEMGNGFGQR